jgi:hypothetical protein
MRSNLNKVITFALNHYSASLVDDVTSAQELPASPAETKRPGWQQCQSGQEVKWWPGAESNHRHADFQYSGYLIDNVLNSSEIVLPSGY